MGGKAQARLFRSETVMIRSRPTVCTVGNEHEPTCQIDYFTRATALLGQMLLENGNGVASCSTPRGASMRRPRGATRKFWSSRKGRPTFQRFHPQI